MGKTFFHPLFFFIFAFNHQHDQGLGNTGNGQGIFVQGMAQSMVILFSFSCHVFENGPVWMVTVVYGVGGLVFYC